MSTLPAGVARLHWRDGNGVPHDFSEHWASGPGLIIWLRHAGCVFFMEEMLQLRELRSSIQSRGARLACVLQTPPARADALCRRHHLEAYVPDPGRQTYRAMGFGQTSLREILFPSAALAGRRTQARAVGCRQNRVETLRNWRNIYQLPGAALIMPDGQIAWRYYREFQGAGLSG